MNVSKKVEGLIQKALLNDGKIDAAEATGIAKAAGKSERGAVAQRLMDDGFQPSATDRQAVAKLLGQADLPKTDFVYSKQAVKNGFVITHVEVDGVKFKLGLAKGQHVDPAVLKQIAGEVNAANKLISDPALKISQVAIADGVTTRMATFGGKPMLVIAPEFATRATAAHESGHAVVEQLRLGKNDDALVRAADIYGRLMNTTSTELSVKKGDGSKEKMTLPSGLWPFDPTQWSKDGTAEHPGDNVDEFFASALSAYRTDRKGLEAAITKFAKIDPAGARPAREMLALLDELSKGKVAAPNLGKAELKAARDEIKRIHSPSAVEDTLALRPALDSALQ